MGGGGGNTAQPDIQLIVTAKTKYFFMVLPVILIVSYVAIDVHCIAKRIFSTKKPIGFYPTGLFIKIR